MSIAERYRKLALTKEIFSEKKSIHTKMANMPLRKIGDSIAKLNRFIWRQDGNQWIDDENNQWIDDEDAQEINVGKNIS